MNILFLIIGVLIVSAAVLIIITITANSKKYSPAEAEPAIKKILQKEVAKSDRCTQGIIYLSSDRYGIQQTFTEGMQVDQPFHTASIGKSFTAVLSAVLIEERKLSLDQKIIELLDKVQLSG